MPGFVNVSLKKTDHDGEFINVSLAYKTTSMLFDEKGSLYLRVIFHQIEGAAAGLRFALPNLLRRRPLAALIKGFIQAH